MFLRKLQWKKRENAQKKRFITESWGKSSLGERVCGRAKLLAGTLRCLRLLLTSSFEVSTRPTVGALPQTPQGTLSLDPARGNCPLTPFRDWVGRTFMLLPRAAFEGLCLSPCLFPQLSVKSQKNEKGKRSRFDGILSPFPKLPCPLQGENDYRLPPFQPQKPISSYVT